MKLAVGKVVGSRCTTETNPVKDRQTIKIITLNSHLILCEAKYVYRPSMTCFGKNTYLVFGLKASVLDC